MKLVLHIAFLLWPVGSLVTCRNLNKLTFLSLDTRDDCFKIVSFMRWMPHVLHISWQQESTKYKLICNGLEGWKVLVKQWTPITRIPWFDFCLAVKHKVFSNFVVKITFFFMFVPRETSFSSRGFYHGQLHFSQSLMFVCLVLSGAQLPKGNFVAMLSHGIPRKFLESFAVVAKFCTHHKFRRSSCLCSCCNADVIQDVSLFLSGLFCRFCLFLLLPGQSFIEEDGNIKETWRNKVANRFVTPQHLNSSP